jgi:hypothetical protein
MLRPLIEGMQNNIRSQTSGNPMDPFGGSNSAPAPASAAPGNVFHEQTLSQTLTQSLQDPALISSSSFTQSRDLTVPANELPPLPPSLVEERPLVSSERDVKPITAMANKISNFQDPATSQLHLSDNQRQLLHATVELLLSSTPLQQLQFPNETFLLLASLLNEFPPLEMACLFLMRLIVLIPNNIDTATVAPVMLTLLNRITHTIQRSSSSSLSSDASDLREFTPSQLVLSLCVVANCLSHRAGCLLLFSPSSGDVNTSASDGEKTLGLCIDSAMWGMCHERPDLRQICGALAYNIALASTQWEQESTAGVQLTWRSLHVQSLLHEEGDGVGENTKLDVGGGGGVEDEEIHPHIVQLLCGSLDNIDAENDPVSLRRRILTAYRVTRSGGSNVKNLALELGYDTVICEVRKRSQETKSSSSSSQDDHHLIVHLENYFRT